MKENIIKGIFYSVGTGPGDPELMTLKAVRIIKENSIIAVPGKNASESAAYRIAVKAVPEIADKELISLDMPMIHDKDKMKEYHQTASDTVSRILDSGENVVFLTLGDPTIYSTGSYIQNILADRGYQTQTISGVPSFCAAAASAGIPLTEWNQCLHIIPASHISHETEFNENDTFVFMKSGRKINNTKEILNENFSNTVMVENCGMENERIFRNAESIPDNAGYFSIIIADSRQ